MPLKLNVGLSKKLGLPDYGSLGASCHVEIELDGGLLHQDLDAFQRHVRNAYLACNQAVAEELARQQGGNNAKATVVHETIASAPPQASSPTPTTTPSTSTATHRTNGNGSNGNGHQASPKQLEYIGQLARQIKGLGVRRVETLTTKMFNKPLVALTSLEASSLIDTLKSAKGGDVDLDQILNGAEAWPYRWP